MKNTRGDFSYLTNIFLELMENIIAEAYWKVSKKCSVVLQIFPLRKVQKNCRIDKNICKRKIFDKEKHHVNILIYIPIKKKS